MAEIPTSYELEAEGLTELIMDNGNIVWPNVVKVIKNQNKLPTDYENVLKLLTTSIKSGEITIDEVETNLQKTDPFGSFELFMVTLSNKLRVFFL